MKRRRRRRNPGNYWVNFALGASALVALLYLGKKLAAPPPALP